MRIISKNSLKNIFYVSLFYYSSYHENSWKFQMFTRDKSNFYLQLYYKLMIIISKTSLKNSINCYRIILWMYNLDINFLKKFMMFEVYIVHNGYIPHTVSCNSSQNFEIWIPHHIFELVCTSNLDTTLLSPYH